VGSPRSKLCEAALTRIRPPSELLLRKLGQASQSFYSRDADKHRVVWSRSCCLYDYAFDVLLLLLFGVISLFRIIMSLFSFLCDCPSHTGRTMPGRRKREIYFGFAMSCLVMERYDGTVNKNNGIKSHHHQG
jgi:hypothetical protein